MTDVAHSVAEANYRGSTLDHALVAEYDSAFGRLKQLHETVRSFDGEKSRIFNQIRAAAKKVLSANYAKALAEHTIDELGEYPLDVAPSSLRALHSAKLNTLLDLAPYKSEWSFTSIRGIGEVKSREIFAAYQRLRTQVRSETRLTFSGELNERQIELLRSLRLLQTLLVAERSLNKFVTEKDAAVRIPQSTFGIAEPIRTSVGWWFPNSKPKVAARQNVARMLSTSAAIPTERAQNAFNTYFTATAAQQEATGEQVVRDFNAEPAAYYALLSKFIAPSAGVVGEEGGVATSHEGSDLSEPLWTMINNTQLDLDGFTAILRPYQEFGVKFLVHQKRTILGDDMGLGKAISNSEPVLTPAGFKPMGELQLGEYAIGSNGQPTQITGVFPQGKRDIYRVTFQDGSFVNCDLEHLWTVQTPVDTYRGKEWRVLTVQQMLNAGLKDKASGNRKFRIPMVEPVQFEAKELPMDPYVLGALLGDGGYSHSYTPNLTSADAELVEAVRQLEPSWTVRALKSSKYGYAISGASRQMREAGLGKQRAEVKLIPELYKHGSVEQRIALLQGLMDTDGWISNDGTICQFTTVSEQLSEDVMWIVRSLGGIGKKTIKTIPKGGNFHPINVTVNLPAPLNPFRLARKAKLWQSRAKYKPARLIDSIEFSHVEEATCIKVDSANELFVTRDFVVTHNTLMGLAYMTHVTNVLEGKHGKRPTHLVVGPLSLQLNWAKEIAKHSSLSYYLMQSKKDEIPAGTDIVVSTYERASDLLKSKIGGAVIVDEAHFIKNAETGRTQRVRALIENKRDVVFMSGTALENNLEEMTRLMGYVNHEVGEKLIHLGNWATPETYRAALAEGYLRRNKEDVLTELPDLVEKQELAAMAPAEHQRYTTILDESSHPWHALRQLGYQSPDFGKAQRVKEIIEEAMERGEKVLLFSYYLNTLTQLQKMFAGVPQIRVDGEVSADERQPLIDKFNEHEGTMLYFSQINTGGVGLNLQSASRVIILEPQVKPSLTTQAIARAHRMGQLNTVFVHTMITQDAIDEAMYELEQSKQEVFDTYVRNSDLGKRSAQEEITAGEVKKILAAQRAKHGVR